MTEDSKIPRLNNLAESLGMEITDFSEGSCVVELAVGEKHLNMGGMAHCGQSEAIFQKLFKMVLKSINQLLLGILEQIYLWEAIKRYKILKISEHPP